MKFKELKKVIYDTCSVIVGNSQEYVLTCKKLKYDDMEVIGVRSRIRMVNGFAANSYVEVLLDASKCSSGSQSDGSN